jgi:predicted MFS family arabinose efflux permease
MAIFISSVPLLLAGNGLPILAAGFFLRSVNRAVTVYLNGVFARSLSDNRKGIILSMFISARSIINGLGSFTGAALYRVGAVVPFLAEVSLMIVLAGVTFLKFFKKDFEGKKMVNLEKEIQSSYTEDSNL